MKKRTIFMSMEEVGKVEVMGKLAKKTITQEQAASLLDISSRQVRRLLNDYRQNGATALISKKRGKAGNHTLSQAVKDTVLALIRKNYHDFGPTLAHEKITEVHGLKISVSLLRQLMIKDGLWIDKKIKKQRTYQLRPRRTKRGELGQMDGSPHAWFEDRGPICTLIYVIDDASGEVPVALFVESESLWSYFDLLRLYLSQCGRPLSLYVDKHGVFRVNAKNPLGGQGITQFGRAMQELGIKLIFANSPQAKGRVERGNQTFQDRLVKELRLQGISTMKEGNAFLSTFLKDFNRRFAVIPQSPVNAHRTLLPEHDLNRIFTIQNQRILSKNLTFQYNHTVYQIRSNRQSYALRKATVDVREKQDGSIAVFYKGKSISFSTHSYQEKQGDIVDSKNLNQIIDNLQYKAATKRKPSMQHPWR